MKNRSRLANLAIFGFILLLGVGILALAWQINNQDQIAPEETQAAAEQVWNAEKFSVDNLATYYEGQNLNQALSLYANSWQQELGAPDASFETLLDFALGDGARFVNDQAIMTVGDETLYGIDLNYFMYLYDFDSLISNSALTDEILNSQLDRILEQSLVLQVAKREGYIDELDPTVFNNVNKDLPKRNQLVNQNLSVVSTLLVENISFEVVKMYYDNIKLDEEGNRISARLDSISKEDAKVQVQQKMNDFYQALITGSKSMYEVGEEIKADTEHAGKVDTVVGTEANAYLQAVNVEKGLNPFTASEGADEKIYGELWALGDGQFSQVISDQDDSAYLIIYVTDRSGALDSVSYADLIENAKNDTNLDYIISK